MSRQEQLQKGRFRHIYKQKSPPAPKPKAAPKTSGPVLPLHKTTEKRGIRVPGQSSQPHAPGLQNRMPSQIIRGTRLLDSDEENDPVVDETDWTLLTMEQKLCASTYSFTMPKYLNGSPADIKEVLSRSRPDSTRYRPSRRNRFVKHMICGLKTMRSGHLALPRARRTKRIYGKKRRQRRKKTKETAAGILRT